MPIITLRDGRTFEMAGNKRLVLALEDNGVDILHRCGGYAGCTTCRVEIDAGEPATMTQAEHDKLVEGENLGNFRLSCQILCDHAMTVHPIWTVSTTDYDSAGKRPQDNITPDPVWIDRPAMN